MILTFRPLKRRPPEWQPVATMQWSRFDSTYEATLGDLEYELNKLNASTPVLQVDASAATVRMDGQLRADARVHHPGVILSFRTPAYGTLTYPCATFYGGKRMRPWQHNLRAIALGLEALRKVERYGIATRGQQYAGYAELGTGIPMGGPSRMSIEDAAKIVATGAGSDWEAGDLLNPDGTVDGPTLRNAYRRAARRWHPDHGGSADVFRRLTDAMELLQKNLG